MDLASTIFFLVFFFWGLELVGLCVVSLVFLWFANFVFFGYFILSWGAWMGICGRGAWHCYGVWVGEFFLSISFAANTKFLTGLRLFVRDHVLRFVSLLFLRAWVVLCFVGDCQMEYPRSFVLHVTAGNCTEAFSFF